MGNCCKVEFQAKHLIFDDAVSQQFRQLQWTENVWIFFAYRFFTFAYFLGWLIYSYASSDGDPFNSPRWQLLSNWCEVVYNVYFLIAFIVSIYVVARRNSTYNDDKPQWYQKLTWLMFTVAANSAFIVTVFYWAVIGRSRSVELNTRPITLHLHVNNSIMFIIETFMVAFPVYYLQFWYENLYGLVYTIFLLILHGAGVNSAVYPAVNWATNTGVAVAYIVAAAVVLPLITHLLVFGLYRLRAFIARRAGLSVDHRKESNIEPSAPRVDDLEMGKTNPAFADSTPNINTSVH